jgi:hypothetical protein
MLHPPPVGMRRRGRGRGRGAVSLTTQPCSDFDHRIRHSVNAFLTELKSGMPSQLRIVRSYVSKLEKIVSKAAIYPRDANKVAFDSMALQSISQGVCVGEGGLASYRERIPR